MSASRHDEILAYTSHLPHLLAFSLTHQLASHDDNLIFFVMQRVGLGILVVLPPAIPDVA